MEINFNFDDLSGTKISISITQDQLMKFIPIITSNDIKKLITNYLIDIQNCQYDKSNKYYIITLPIKKNILKCDEILYTNYINLYKHKCDPGYTISIPYIYNDTIIPNYSQLQIYFGKIIKTRYDGRKTIIGKRKFTNIFLLIDNNRLKIKQGYGGKEHFIY